MEQLSIFQQNDNPNLNIHLSGEFLFGKRFILTNQFSSTVSLQTTDFQIVDKLFRPHKYELSYQICYKYFFPS